jgi:hypothetical protein
MANGWPDVIRSAAGPGRRRIFERGDVIGAGALIAWAWRFGLVDNTEQ